MSAVMGPDAPTADDRRLVLSARSGDRAAREALGRRVGRAAYVFAWQLTGERDLALDVAQDGVVRFLGSLDRFDPERRIEPWLYQIVRNRVRDLARRDRVRRHESLDALLDDGRQVDLAAADDPAVDAERTELQRRLWRAVSQLSEPHREIFVLRDYHGLSYREIADTLSIPEGTVMSRLHAARTRLRALMGPDERPATTDRRSDR